MPDTRELGAQLLAARPAGDDDALVEAMVAGRLFGPAHAAAAKIGRFTLLERLGRGGTSDVYAAYDPTLDRKVALKLLRTDAGVHRLDDDERGWLLREARAAARLAHPNVVAVHEVGELGDGGNGIYVAMEHIDGVTLRAWLREGRSLDAVLGVFVHAGLGLAAAHEAGVIHRDFKPENVLVCGEGAEVRGRVVDFGLARATSEGHEPQQPLMGTPAYMAPEQLEGRALDARCDQFAFCVALHEALAGQHPFGADEPGASPARLLARIAAGERPRGERALPGWLRSIVRRGLQLEPADRYPSMRALVRVLRATPARRRRRWLALAAVALVGGSVTLTVASLPSEPGSRCTDREQELQGIWDPSLKTSARAAFANAGFANSDEVWERLEPRIDDYTRNWVASREQTCEGRLGGGTLSTELTALRDVCLDRRRAELRGLTELLEQPDRTTLVAALTAVDRLTPVASCDDVESLRREASLDASRDDPTVEALHQEILRRTTQAQAGRARELGQPTQALLARARELGAPIPLAEALALDSLVAEANGKYDDAAASLEAAALEAIAARHDRLHALITTRLVWVHGVRRHDFAAAQRWATHSQAAIRSTHGDPILTARLLDYRGTLASVMHDASGAVELHRQAIALLQSSAAQSKLELARSSGNLGLALLADGKVEEATPLIEEALGRYRESLGPHHPDVAAMLSNLGQAYVAARDPARAVARLNEALELKEQLYGPDHVELLTTLTSLGGAYAELGRGDAAREALRRGVAIGERELGPESPAVEELLYNIAFDSWLLGDHEALVHDAERVLAVQRRMYGEAHPLLALSYELLARGQLGVGDPGLARDTIERALALPLEQLGTGERGNVLLSAAWIEHANDAPPARVRALASQARALLGDDPGPDAAKEIAVLLGP